MQLDWITVVAQIVNFLVLVYLLKRFLYKPVLTAMASREQNIVDQQLQAEQAMLRANDLIEEYQHKHELLRQQHAQKLAAIENEVDSERTKLLEQLRQEISDKRLNWLTNLDKEQNILAQDIKIKLGDNIVRISRQILDDLAGAELEVQMVHMLLNRLRQFSPKEKQALADTLSADGVINVISHFPMAADLRERINQELASIKPEIITKFEQRTEPVCGIKLETDQQVWSWSIDHYLEQLQTTIADMIKQQSPMD